MSLGLSGCLHGPCCAFSRWTEWPLLWSSWEGGWQEAKKAFLGESFTNSVCFKTQLIDTFLNFETTLA